jgi:tellurium resistance protein TerD
MTVSLQKGGNVSLSKASEDSGGSLGTVTVGLGWDARTTDGADFDLDASAFVLDGNDQALGDSWFVFFGNLQSPDSSVTHRGDNLTGAGDGDDEQISVNLASLPPTAEKVDIAVTIYEADSRGQNFGGVKNAFVRIVDDSTGTELARFDLGEDFALETAVVFGQVYRYNGEWKFKAIGAGYSNGLKGLCTDRGVHV